MAIIFQIVYVILRMIFPFGSRLVSDDLENIQVQLRGSGMTIYNGMPLMHLIAMFLMFFQVFYFFKVLNFLSKYVQLIFKGLSDSAGFLILFVLFEIFFAVSFHVLGAGMDGGAACDENADMPRRRAKASTASVART